MPYHGDILGWGGKKVNTEVQDFFHKAVDVATRLRLVRVANRLRQGEMAGALDMSASNYSKMEIGARRVTPETIGKLCRRFGVSEEWMREGKGEGPRDVAGQLKEAASVVREPGCVYPECTERMKPYATVDDAIGFLASQFSVDRDELRKALLELLANFQSGRGKDPIRGGES